MSPEDLTCFSILKQFIACSFLYSNYLINWFMVFNSFCCLTLSFVVNLDRLEITGQVYTSLNKTGLTGLAEGLDFYGFSPASKIPA